MQEINYFRCYISTLGYINIHNVEAIVLSNTTGFV